MALPTLLIGATGPMGRAVIARAASTDTPIRAFARHPEALADVEVETVPGDVLDKDAQEALIRNADLDATIVRPAVLVSTPSTTPIQAVVDLAPGRKMARSAATTSPSSAITEVTGGSHVGETVHLFS